MMGPTRAFGTGLERAAVWIGVFDHVREAIAFPRLLYRLYP